MSGTSTQQWLRQVSLIIGRQGGQPALDLSQLHVIARVSGMTVSNPATADITVYNVSNDTKKFLLALPTVTPGAAAGLPSATSGRVLLQAGYQGNFGTIFQGEIVQARSGRDSPADTFIQVLAADGSQATALAIINNGLAAGWTHKDVSNQIGQAYGQYGISVGDLPDSVPTTQAPRGKVMFGFAQDHLRTLERTNGMTSFITAGTLNYWDPTQPYQQDQVTVVKSDTGMIGLPQQTTFGVQVRTLLNPSIGPGGLIQINNASIQRLPYATSYGSTDANTFLDALNKYADSSADGYYRVLLASHSLDTRGNDFYTDLTCVAADPTVQKVVPDDYLLPFSYLAAS